MSSDKHFPDRQASPGAGQPSDSQITPKRTDFMTYGTGESQYNDRLRSMLDNDSGYGGSISDDASFHGLSEDRLTPFNTPGRNTEGHLTSETDRRALASHVHQLYYNQNRTALGRAIQQTIETLKKLQEMNATWPAHYPTVKRPLSPPPSRPDPRPGLHHTQSTLGKARELDQTPTRPAAPRRAGTSLGEARSEAESSSAPAKAPAAEPRLVTPQLAQQFSVLKIELKMEGASQTELVHSLEKQSIASLLDGQINNSVRHLFSLRERIEDTSSKVLVTGDLNAGKSTFCNALLRRKVLPEDQQPCTSIFCEVLDVRENGGIEEAHAIPIGVRYDRNDESTYDVFSLDELEKVVVDNEKYSQCKIYIKDIRSVDQSLLNNGVVDIALIDAPGLNNDSLKTTAVFARQEEIDVVVFVVSAANHFTLSAKEFIFNAAREKAYMFMVVNGFDNIRDKKRCQEMILKQIAQLSPATFKESSELVHFVSSNAIPVKPPGPPGPSPPYSSSGGGGGGGGSDPSSDPFDTDPTSTSDNDTTGKHGSPGSEPEDKKGKGKEKEKIDDFNELEASLRRFVLEKRARSKLAPAKTYLLNVLGDLHSLATVNKDVAQAEMERVESELASLEPALEGSKKSRTEASEGVDGEIEDTTAQVYDHTRATLGRTIDGIATARLGVEYPGLWSVYSYADDIKGAMLEHISATVRECEGHARERTMGGVSAIKSLGILHLGDQYVDLTFRSEKMFRSKRDALARSVHVDVEVWDFLDVSSLWERQEKLAGTSMAVTVAGVLGGRVMGGVGWLDGTLGVAKVVGVNNLKRVILPGMILAVGLGISYALSSIPTSLPRRLSAKLALQLQEIDYIHTNATRISSEVRRALKYPADKLRMGLQQNVDNLADQRRDKVKVKGESEVARKFFGNLVREAGDVRSRVQRVDLEGPATVG